MKIKVGKKGANKALEKIEKKKQKGKVTNEDILELLEEAIRLLKILVDDRDRYDIKVE